MLLSAVISMTAYAQPKPLVQIADTQDRWITFSDGGRLTHGFEISYLLMKYMFDSGKYQIIAPGIGPISGVQVMSSKSTSSPQAILKERLPNINFDFLSQISSRAPKKVSQL